MLRLRRGRGQSGTQTMRLSSLGGEPLVFFVPLWAREHRAPSTGALALASAASLTGWLATPPQTAK